MNKLKLIITSFQNMFGFTLVLILNKKQILFINIMRGLKNKL